MGPKYTYVIYIYGVLISGHIYQIGEVRMSPLSPNENERVVPLFWAAVCLQLSIGQGWYTANHQGKTSEKFKTMKTRV